MIDHCCACSEHYIGSPSIVILPSGEYITSHDEFGPGTTQDTTFVFSSRDLGKSWQKRVTIRGQWWSTLFVHHGDLYLVGTSKEYGYCVIRKSLDGGNSWSEPQDQESGIIRDDGRYHCAPVPVVLHQGRVWRAMEEYIGPKWGAFRAFVISANEDTNLLKASSWISTNRIGVSRKWLDGKVGGILEGNVIVAPNGKIANILRVDHPSLEEYAALMLVSEDGKALSFDSTTGFIRMPGGSKKFTIRYDEVSKRCWSLVNAVTDLSNLRRLKPREVRNKLVLASSANLTQWEMKRVILEHPDAKMVGFQYADWVFDGSDIITAVRTAFPEEDGTNAHNAHDANWLTFHRIERFRE